MNKIIKITAFCFLAALIFAACKREITNVYYKGGTAPVVTAVTSQDTVSYVNASKAVLTLNWTNPDYNFTTGVSSQDVNYKIQIDTAGSDFSKAYSISVSKNLTYTFTATQLNDIMQNQLNLIPAVPHTLEMKVLASLSNNSALLTSNSVQYTSIPYVVPPKVTLPPSAELYLVGSATEGGWNNPVPVPSQKFTKLSDTHYTLTVTLIGGQQFLFLPVNGDWSHKYACKSTGTQSADGGDFGYDFSDNFPGPATDGTYQFDIDFQKGKYSVTKQ